MIITHTPLRISFLGGGTDLRGFCEWEEGCVLNARFDVLCKMKQLAIEARECPEQQAFDEFGELLHQGWEYKKQLASGISNGQIDAMYRAACRAGAIGGKISGAGGGGFLPVYCPVERRDDVRRALAPSQELTFALERDGSKVIFNYR